MTASAEINNRQAFYQSFVLKITCAFLLLIVSFALSLSAGSVPLSMTELVEALWFCPQQCEAYTMHYKIIWEIRLPRILMALITGAGLAITGAILQSVTRNPLADPYLFGISSGSALGAVIVLSLISSAAISLTLGALAGGLFSVVLMLVLAGPMATQVERLLLAGVAVSFMLSAFTGLVLYYSKPDTAATLLFWMMGSFSNSQWPQLWMPLTVVVLGICFFSIYRRWLSVVQAGDEMALTLGIPVNRLRLFMLILCSVITAVLVAHVGGIGFVGLMIPHMSRFIVGAQIHRILLMCVLLGGSFMMLVDVIARSLLQHQVLPVGIVTSAVGSVFFFIILKQRSHKY